MVLSYYVFKPLYLIVWYILKPFRKHRLIILYCDDVFDLTLFKNIQKHLKQIPIIAKNNSIAQTIRAMGVSCSIMPAFPDAVIMFRNMAWKFPCKKILKFGFEHGAYNFKKFSNSHYYNLFTVFFMTSSHDVERVKKIGVRTGEAIGFPKIDSAFDGSITKEHLANIVTTLHLDPNKKTILFSATWDGSGMSAVHLWYDKLDLLVSDYNILITLHPWVSKQYRDFIKSNPKLHFIEDPELLRYIMLSDCCIGDTSSIIAEFSLLDKPIITFKLPPTPRTMSDIIEIIENISIRINTFDELPVALNQVFNVNSPLTDNREKATALFFDKPDGLAGKRAADRILSFLPELLPEK
jgi:hypothetical protein